MTELLWFGQGREQCLFWGYGGQLGELPAGHYVVAEYPDLQRYPTLPWQVRQSRDLAFPDLVVLVFLLKLSARG